MQNSDMLISEIKKRETTLRKAKEKKRITLFSSLSGVLSVCLILSVIYILPSFEAFVGETAPLYYGASLSENPMAGFIVIVLLAFALGVSVTLLCIKLREKKEHNDKNDR